MENQNSETKTNPETDQTQTQTQTSTQEPKPVPESISRAEFEALSAKIEALGRASAPKSAPNSELSKLQSQVSELVSSQAADRFAARKAQLIQSALDGVPDSSRGLASLAIDGLLSATGADLAKADIPALARNIAETLRNQHPTLYQTPGSSHSAIPAKPDGSYDWSGVNSLSEVPAGMQSKMPREVWDRLVSGQPANPGNSGGIRPRTRYH